MPETFGFYAILQYHEHPERAEGANVGVLLFVPGPGPQPVLEVAYGWSPRAESTDRRDLTRQEVQELVGRFVRRIRGDCPTDLTSFRRALGREAGPIRAVGPRGTLVEGGPEATAQRLCTWLVD